MEENKLYRVYSKYLKEKYGEKVYKLPINLPVTCPNRDGCVGYGGCIFCGEKGAGFENLSNVLSVREQLIKNKDYISKRYKAMKFIAYFQNFTNTYLPLERFKGYIKEAIMDDIVEIDISTRPDCISEKYLKFLDSVKKEYDKNITVELGLQTVNYHTLKKINRGHSLAEFIDSVQRIKKYGFNICVHLILNLPWDDMDDVIENAKIISALGIEQVKLHSLYIVEDTIIGKMYKEGRIKLGSKDEYIKRVITFLEYLHPDIVVQRLIGRAPKEDTLFVNWDTSWWKIKDEIIKTMKQNNSYQGKRCNYLNGKALIKFN
ncbi:TIGR01212 family radical SAM protein [Thermohalobacter berrensis]|uniref:TIGR01212 family radical SAM protein n=1 Tax=Thermohalobacter berrensis TaxID=99594 RepID=A0A419T2A0_9FIRM|nr:TIGR01212 family radical SAM protein [Thermohalobacter berrensis]RKD31559.1 TIGR01212 family radical SAM protein [Thermohalobacter berrensis]